MHCSYTSQKQDVEPEKDWCLRVTGLVDETFALSMNGLYSLPSVEQFLTVICVGSSGRHPLIKQNLWKGIRLESALWNAHVNPSATHVQIVSTDGYTTSIPINMLRSALLAYGVDGATLSPSNGYPLRLVVPGLYAHKMPKRIQQIEYTTSPVLGHHELQGWKASGEVRITSYIFSPHHAQVVSGSVMLSGVAYAGLRTITQIEVSIDDADWMPVAFTTAQPGAWTEWRAEWQPPAAGDYSIRVRATDSDGLTQTEQPNLSAFPNGSSAIHRIVVRISSPFEVA